MSSAGAIEVDNFELWWLVPLALFTLSLVVAGDMAPYGRQSPWIRLYAHGRAYTALLVVSLSGSAATAAWIIPTIIGLPLIVVEPSRERLIELGTLVDRGVLSSVVDRAYALEDARAAFERLPASGNFPQ